MEELGNSKLAGAAAAGSAEGAFVAGEDLLGRAPVPFDSTGLADRLGGRRILVAGAGGSVGTALSSFLASYRPAELVLLEEHEPSLFRLRARLLASYPEGSYRWTLADVADERKIAAVYRETRPEIVFNLAAHKHVPLSEENIDQTIKVNVFGTVAMIRQAELAGVECFVYPSTDKAVNPPSIYGATKRVVERFIAEYARSERMLSPRVVRLVNVFGTQGSVIETFTRQILAGEPLTITDPRMTRYWMTMREAAELLAWTTTADRSAGIYMLALGPAAPLEETARRLAERLRPGIKPEFRYVGIRPGERLAEELAYDYERIEPVGSAANAGVVMIRDTRARPTEGSSAGFLDELKQLEEGLYSLDRAELRRRLFALATGA